MHEEQTHSAQLGGHTVDITAQDGRQIGVDHGGVAAPDQFHQRADFVRHRDLAKSALTRECGEQAFVLRMAVGVHQHDRQRAVAVGVQLLQRVTDRRRIRRLQDLAVRADAFIDFDHLRIEQLGQYDVAIEDTRPVLIGDAQRVAKAACNEQCGALALAFEQGIGGHCGAHLDRFDLVGRNRRAGFDAEDVPDAGDRGVRIARRVFREQLVGNQRAIRFLRHDIGEGAAAIDPDIPAGARSVHGGSALLRGGGSIERSRT